MVTTTVVVFATPSCAYAAGVGVRELLAELGSRPLWATRRRAWVTTPERARDLIALLEARGRRVRVADETDAEVIARVGGAEHHDDDGDVEPPEAGGSLW